MKIFVFFSLLSFFIGSASTYAMENEKEFKEELRLISNKKTKKETTEYNNSKKKYKLKFDINGDYPWEPEYISIDFHTDNFGELSEMLRKVLKSGIPFDYLRIDAGTFDPEFNQLVIDTFPSLTKLAIKSSFYDESNFINRHYVKIWTNNHTEPNNLISELKDLYHITYRINKNL
ncbi:hypothetical protein Bealeia1_01810 [Candidatus Bealeia paramacronuclearis]|uniref:Uncharacterized protein n=1 Tax=Candidatus Bealeia paramacronuclearis TaxID=1921001 RepID=A0ABZ2C532_9PROT|nr:hypothetical protein [Candidatus Bealeia paramacronuclearis]